MPCAAQLARLGGSQRRGAEQSLSIYAPPMQAIFSTFPLSAQSLLVSALVGAINVPVIALEKLIRNRRRA